MKDIAFPRVIQNEGNNHDSMCKNVILLNATRTHALHRAITSPSYLPSPRDPLLRIENPHFIHQGI